jgi:hypothetical protein
MQVPKDFLLGTDSQEKESLIGLSSRSRLARTGVPQEDSRVVAVEVGVQRTLYWALGLGCMHLIAFVIFLSMVIAQQDTIFLHDVDVVRPIPCWKSQYDIFNVFESINMPRKKTIAGCVIIFHFLSGFFQTVPFWWYKTLYPPGYAHRVGTNGIMYLRFIEYSLSAPTVLVAISLVVGIMDIFTLVFIATLTMLCMIMGLSVDILRYMAQTATVNDKARLWKLIIGLHCMGWIAIAVPWYTILAGFFSGKSNILSTSDNVCGKSIQIEGVIVELPAFVQPLLFTECVLFSVFGFVQMWQLYVQGWRDTGNEFIGVWCERVYIFLSFASKLTLGATTFASILFADDA